MSFRQSTSGFQLFAASCVYSLARGLVASTVHCCINTWALSSRLPACYCWLNTRAIRTAASRRATVLIYRRSGRGGQHAFEEIVMRNLEQSWAPQIGLSKVLPCLALPTGWAITPQRAQCATLRCVCVVVVNLCACEVNGRGFVLYLLTRPACTTCYETMLYFYFCCIIFVLYCSFYRMMVQCRYYIVVIILSYEI